MHAADRDGRDRPGQARVRAEAADAGRWTKRASWRARRGKQTKVATQMGNQGHSWDDGRRAVEWMQSGAIGDVHEVHVWTNRPLAYWPQGIPRPEPQRISRRTALEHARRDGAARQRDGPVLDARQAVVGSVPRPGPAGRVSPGVSPVQLARVGRLGRAARSATWART